MGCIGGHEINGHISIFLDPGGRLDLKHGSPKRLRNSLGNLWKSCEIQARPYAARLYNCPLHMLCDGWLFRRLGAALQPQCASACLACPCHGPDKLQAQQVQHTKGISRNFRLNMAPGDPLRRIRPPKHPTVPAMTKGEKNN